MNVYRLTQRAKVATDTPARIATIIVLAFDDDGDADRFVTAMIRAQLASVLEDGRVTIHGNTERIRDQEAWFAGLHESRVAGGRARASQGKRNSSGRFEKLNDLPARHPARVQLDTSCVQQNQHVLSLKSLVLGSNTEETTKNLDLPSTPKPKRTRKPKESSGASPPEGRTTAFRAAWLDGYRKKYGEAYPWGARENGQTANLLGSYTSEQLVSLVPYWFAWQRPEVIRGGHSFGKGAHSFVMKLDELRADIADSSRRKQAAQAEDAEKQANKAIAGMSQAERVAAKLSGEENGNDDHHQESVTPRTARPEQTNFVDARAFQSKALG